MTSSVGDLYTRFTMGKSFSNVTGVLALMCAAGIVNAQSVNTQSSLSAIHGLARDSAGKPVAGAKCDPGGIGKAGRIGSCAKAQQLCGTSVARATPRKAEEQVSWTCDKRS